MRHLLPYLLPMLLSLVFVSTAHTIWLWLSPFLIFLAGVLTSKVGEFSVQQVLNEFVFFHYSRQMALFKTVNGIFFVLLNGWAFYFLMMNVLPSWQLIIFIYSLIVLNSNFAISLAHDLMHSHHQPDRLLASILLLQNGFFYLEADHIYIHHQHVGTSQDPATPRLNESIYAYFQRSFSQRIRLIFDQHSVFPVRTGKKIIQLTWLKAGLCIAYLTLAALINRQLFYWITCQYIFVILIYESITYIQHYGLKRLKSANQYEPIQLQHAWNSYYKLNTYLYFMMPIHSLHHVYKPDLSSINNFAGPRMPLPFARMMVTAYWPARWFAMMDEKVLAVQQGYQHTI